MLAASDCARFGFGALKKLSSTTTVEDGPAPINAGPSSQNLPTTLDSSPSSATASDPFPTSFDVLDHLDTALERPAIPPDFPEPMANLLDITPSQVNSLFDQFRALDDQLDLSAVPPPSDAFAALFNAFPNPTNTGFEWFDNPQFGGSALENSNLIPVPNVFATTPIDPSRAFDTGNPAQPGVSVQQFTTATVPPQKGGGLSPLISGSQPAEPSDIQSLDILAGINDEPTWMKKRHTLDFFRNTPKFGRLSSVIEHWYQLEKLLGFYDTVSFFFIFENSFQLVLKKI